MTNKLTLIALFALFLAPVLVAIVLHSEWVDWRAAPEKAHGALIDPVVPLGEFKHVDAGGTTRDLSDLLDRWQLVLIAGRTCNEACLETAELMHNIRLSQNRQQDEVGLIMLIRREMASKTRRRINELDPAWLLFDGAAGQALTARLPDPDAGSLYIVDPQANIIERFGPGADLNGVRKDLDRLLTWTLREQP